MIRITDSVLMAMAAAGAIYTFQIKHEAELAAKQLDTLQAQISAQDRKIALLEADWALETAPARLERIASQFNEQLQLQPMESTQIIDISELPGLRVERGDGDQEIFAQEQDGAVTGGIGALIDKAGNN